MKTKILLFTILMIPAMFTKGQIINVPADQPSIQAGINVANDGDTVLVAEDTYLENIRFMGKAITVGSQYIMDGDESHIDNTIIDGSSATNPDSAATVMFVNGEDTTSIINGFTITGGSGVFNPIWGVQHGGGVFTYNAGVKIINNIISGNHVEGSIAGGAGIGCMLDGGDYWAIIDNNTINYNTSTANGFSAFAGGMSVLINAIITNNTVEYNTCTNTGGPADGGGIEVEKYPGTSFSFYIGNNIIRYNELDGSTNAIGAGIMSIGALAVIENNIIEGNSATAPDYAWGGGIATHSSVSGITIISNSIKNNYIEADYAYGGGINLYNCGTIRINNNDICNNSGEGYSYMAGGAVRVHTTLDSTIIKNNLMYYNSTSSDSHTAGGAVNIYPAGLNPVLLCQNKIGHNAATYGGALRTYNTYNISIINNLFADNEATYGGAVYLQQSGDDKGEQFDPKNIAQEYYINNPVKTDTSFPVLINNTFKGNAAVVRGGAIYSDLIFGAPVVFNSIFWENEAYLNYNIFSSSPEDMLIAWCDIDTLGIYGSWQGNANIFEDPIFTDTLCHIIGPTSPCADAGTDSISYNGLTLYCPSNDYEGDIRPYNYGIPDMGADETDIWVGIKPSIALSDNQILYVYQNYPNPFSASTVFSYTLLKPSHIKLEIYEGNGKKIAELINQQQEAGDHHVVWNAGACTSGIYYYNITAGDQTEVRKMILK